MKFGLHDYARVYLRLA